MESRRQRKRFLKWDRDWFVLNFVINFWSTFQLLHPHITVWGPLLRLYGNNSVKSFKEKKQEEQEITVLQNKAIVNQPNYAILDKLKEEMMKLKTVKPRNPITESPMNHVITTIQVKQPVVQTENLNN